MPLNNDKNKNQLTRIVSADLQDFLLSTKGDYSKLLNEELQCFHFNACKIYNVETSLSNNHMTDLPVTQLLYPLRTDFAVYVSFILPSHTSDKL